MSNLLRQPNGPASPYRGNRQDQCRYQRCLPTAPTSSGKRPAVAASAKAQPSLVIGSPGYLRPAGNSAQLGASPSSPHRGGQALCWHHVNLDGDYDATSPVPRHVEIWRSVRVNGETKTERSRRTLGLLRMAVEALAKVSNAVEDLFWVVQQATASDNPGVLWAEPRNRLRTLLIGLEDRVPKTTEIVNQGTAPQAL